MAAIKRNLRCGRRQKITMIRKMRITQKTAAPPFITSQPPCRTGVSTQLTAALTQHTRNADTTLLLRACTQEQLPHMPIRGATCSFARGMSQPSPCYDHDPHPPLLGWKFRDLCLLAPPIKRQTFLSVANMTTMSAQHVGNILLCRPIFGLWLCW